MEDACSILPQDCWELIFNFVDDLEALSLVCKDFLSISSRLVHYLPVHGSSIKILTRLLRRFRCLKTIDLSDFDRAADLNHAVLVEIARSGLNVETLILSPDQYKFRMESFTELGSYMKSLKALDCSMIGYIEDNDLAVIASSLPWLEELDISTSFIGIENLTDAGIEMLSKSLTNLRKINISGNEYLSVRSLLSLSSNCPSLRKIKARGCGGGGFRIQDCAVGHLFHCRFPNLLVSISVSDDDGDDADHPDHHPSPTSIMFVRNNSISFAKNIYDIRFSRYKSISDDILCAIAVSNLPLKRFELSHCRNVPRKGFAMLLRAYQSQLKELDLYHTALYDEKEFIGLVQYLQNLTHINLRGCRSFTSETLFSLIRNCPSLVNINMAESRLGGGYEGNLGLDLLVKNHHIRNLRLSNNRMLDDKLLIKIGLCCPNLQLLNVRYCNGITIDGIGEIFKCCKKIKDLFCDYVYNNGTNLFRTDLGLSELMLEWLEVTWIDDEGMEIIAKRCPRLRKLNLYSMEVTNKGVMVVVEKCRRLKEIDLRHCSKVTDDIFPLMVSSRPSLRKIVPPREDFVPNEDQADLFLLHADRYLMCNR